MYDYTGGGDFGTVWEANMDEVGRAKCTTGIQHGDGQESVVEAAHWKQAWKRRRRH